MKWEKIRTMSTWLTGVYWCILMSSLGALPAVAQSNGLPSTQNGEWPHYTADLKGTRYSPLDQINASNFSVALQNGQLGRAPRI